MQSTDAFSYCICSVHEKRMQWGKREEREKPLSVPVLNTENSLEWWEFIQCLFGSDREAFSFGESREVVFYLFSKMVINFAAGPAKLPDEVSWRVNFDDKIHQDYSPNRYWLKFRRNLSTTMAQECPSWKCRIAVQRTWKFTKTQSNRVAIFCKRILSRALTD